MLVEFGLAARLACAAALIPFGTLACSDHPATGERIA
jgi:hypothetical protein